MGVVVQLTNIATQTYPAAPGGMNRDLPQHAIPDTDAWTLADCLVNTADLIRRRGPLDESDSVSGARSIGLTRVQNVDGNEAIAQLVQTSTPAGALVGSQGSGLNFAWPTTPSIAPYTLFSHSDMLNGGKLIGSADDDQGTNNALGMWMGASANTLTMTLSANVNLGDTTVSVSSATGAGAGQFVFAQSGALIGVIKSISGGTITLLHPAIHTDTSGHTITAKPVRGLNPRVDQGTITTDTGSATVNGGSTRFSAQGLATGSWDLFTTNFTYIGTVSSVQSDTQLTLVSDAAVALANDDYIAIHQDGSYSMTANQLGYIQAQFGGHQFYAKGNSIYFSSLNDPEAVDLTIDGSNLSFSSDPVRALIPTLTSILSFSENEVYELTGAIGTTPDRWRGDRVHDDGTICGMSAVAYKGGAIWAGKRGVWFFDGTSPINLVQNLGDDYRNFVMNATRAWGGVIHDHFMLFIEDGEVGSFWKTKGTDVEDLDRLTLVINLVSGAVTFFTNVEMRGWIPLPSAVTIASALFSISTDTPAAMVCLGDSLLLDEGQDIAACEDGPGAGPDFYVESKMFDIGDPQRTKKFRLLMLHYNSNGGNLVIDTVPGLDTIGTTQTSQYIDTDGAYQDNKVNFSVTCQVMAFRLYQSTISGVSPNTTTADVVRVTIGPWAFGYRLKRPGRT